MHGSCFVLIMQIQTDNKAKKGIGNNTLDNHH